MSTPKTRRPQTRRPRPAGSTGPRTPGARRSARPLPPGKSLYTPSAGPARGAVERFSARALVLLHQLPAWVLPVVMVALLVAGFAARGWFGAAALAVLAAVLGWLAYVSWPRLAAPGRLLRVAAVTVTLAIAALQAGR